MSKNLYDTLFRNVPDKDLTPMQKKKFIDMTAELNVDGMEIVYAIILRFNSATMQKSSVASVSKSDIDELPYKAERIGEDIIFDIDKLPVPLRQAIFQFVTKHIQHQHEDKNRTVQTMPKYENVITV